MLTCAHPSFTITRSGPMTLRLRLLAIAAIVVATAPAPRAQKAPVAAPKKNPLLKLAEPWPDADVLKARRQEAEGRPLFNTVDPLEFTLTAPFSLINKDHTGETTNPSRGPLPAASREKPPGSIDEKLSAGGLFRRMARNCSGAPLGVEFPKEGTAGTVFEGQTTLKLGTGCEDSK